VGPARCTLVLVGLAACAAPRPTEFINITFTPSVETGHYRTWDFELESCRGFEDPRVDDERLRPMLLEAMREEIEARGFRYAPGGPVDFRVFYELWVADTGDAAAVEERARGRIFVRDVESGRLVWRGERKAPVSVMPDDAARAAAVRSFAADLLQYTSKLEDPGEAEPGS